MIAYVDAVDVTVVDETNVTLIDAWLQGVPEQTQRAYRREIRDLLAYTSKPLKDITMLDLQAYERDRVMLNLFYQTGMRVSEVVALTWKDMLRTPTGATLVVYGKGGKTRYVAIDEEMTAELLALPHTANCVFPSNKTGQAMTTTQAQRIVVDCAERAGIDASPHFFRHAHISHLGKARVDVATIRDEVGHASIATTNKYLHSRPGKPLGSILRRK